MARKIVSIILLSIAVLTVAGFLRTNRNGRIATPTDTTAPTGQNPEPTKLLVSNELQEYADDNFNYSFSYPESLAFETQSPLPGGTIKALGVRVDGLTESQLLSKDLKTSLKSNDLYCNLDGSYGEAVCTNKNVEAYTNSKGTAGYKVEREKTFYDEESGDPEVFRDFVYAFPVTEKNRSVSSYKAVVFTVKLPSQENLKVLERIADTVTTH